MCDCASARALNRVIEWVRVKEERALERRLKFRKLANWQGTHAEAQNQAIAETMTSTLTFIHDVIIEEEQPPERCGYGILGRLKRLFV